MSKAANTPRNPRRKRCECCKQLYVVASAWLKGLCGECSKGLGGGEYSATAVKVEQRALKLGIGFKTRR